MKKFLPIAVVCILVLSGIGAVALSEEEQEYLEKNYSLSFSKPILKDEGEEVPVTDLIAFIGDKDEEIPIISEETKQ